MKGRVQKTRPAEVPGVTRRVDPEGVLSQVVYDLVRLCEGFCEAGPDARRIDLRALRFRLSQAYPGRFAVSETDLMQQLAEEDGDAIEDAP